MPLPQPAPSTEPLALALTEDEVRRLLDDKTLQTRLELTERIAGSYGEHHLTPMEVLAAEQIFRLLVRDAELRVRVALADRLKDSDSVAHDIVMTMAQDVAEVSLPVLQYSEVLTDDDLIGLIHDTQDTSRHIAVSKRQTVSEAVSDTLIGKGNAEVASTLVNNDGARITDSSLQKIIDTHPQNSALQQAAKARPRLPAAAAEKVIHAVSSSLANELKEKTDLPQERIAQEVDAVRESETLKLVRLSRSEEEVEKLVGQLFAFNRLTPSIILSALCQGNFTFFENSLARLSHISPANARALISDRGELGFHAIYSKSGLPDAMFPAVRLLLRVVRELDTEGEYPGTSRYANRIVERILQYSEETPIENLSYIIALVRRIAQ